MVHSGTVSEGFPGNRFQILGHEEQRIASYTHDGKEKEATFIEVNGLRYTQSEWVCASQSGKLARVGREVV